MHNYPIPKTAPLHLRSSSTTSNSTAPDSARRDSSLQKVWAEDYYADDYAGGLENRFEEDTGGLSPPPAATLTTRPFPRSIPLSSDEEAFPARDHRQHQRSLTTLLPFRSRTNSESPTRSVQTSPQHSPVKEKLDVEFMATLSGDKDGKIRVADKSKGGLSSWFSGSSAPVAVGIVNEQDDSSMVSPQGPPEQSGKLPRRPTLATLDSPTTAPTKAPTSRWGLFSAPKTPVAKTIQIPAGMMTDDELFTLDINKALFPSGAPSDRDPFSPSSFKNLLMNAEGLLLKLQTAYKIRTISLHEITAEKEVQAEELEEADLRAKHLKLQLEDMGRKLQSQDAAIAELATELAQEKKARAEEREAREKSIALVKFSREELAMKAINGATPSPQVHEEDLGISHAGQRKHKWRKSNLSMESTEGESDDDTTNDSVFSRSRSPTFADSSNASIMTSETAPEVAQASFGRVIPSQALPTIGRPKPVQQASTFQKILKGISSSDTPPKDNMGGVGLEEGCSNCRGGDSGVAWDAVGLLRAENKGLKERVGELEDAVDGALDMCEGVWLRRV